MPNNIHATLTGVGLIPPSCGGCVPQTTISFTYDPAIDRWTGDLTLTGVECIPGGLLHIEMYCLTAGGLGGAWRFDTAGCTVQTGLVASQVVCKPALDIRFSISMAFGECCNGAIDVVITL